MKIYVASSWRNEHQPEVVKVLRLWGHEVYDFRNPREGDNGFQWSEIDPYWESWTPEKYRESLAHPLAEAGFASDMKALRWCDAVVGVQPFGRSASLELGWAAGAGKQTVLLLASGEPELMVKMCDHICVRIEEVLKVLGMPEKEKLMEKVTVVCEKDKHWEYRCKSCGQLRFWPSEQKPKECGSCGSNNIVTGRPGKLPSTLLFP